MQEKTTDIEAKRKSSLEISGPNAVSKQNDFEQEIAERSQPMDKKKNSSLELINASDTCINADIEGDTIQRESLIDKISHKKVAFKLMDIFDLCDPPERFKVREKDENFISLLSQQMIEKQSMCIDNAPTVIGHIDMDRSKFKESEFDQYDIHLIDGNHSIEAQKKAYRISKNINFRFRGVNIYCGLKEDEALLLGISRNEDTSCFLNFSDFQKVDLLRRRLYAMTGTPLDKDPPEVPKTFKDIFCCLLNLKTKKDIDGKYILKFLSTSLSNRCYSLYKEICLRRMKLPASKFDCLRGLSEEDIYSFLRCLADSRLEKNDWLNFMTACQQKQKKKKPRKDVIVTIDFEQTVTRIFNGDKQMNGNVVCFKICTEKDEIFLSAKELKNRIFEEPKTVGCFSEPTVVNKAFENLKEFLSVMADERCAHLAMNDNILIEEESVETIPTKVIESSDVILDRTIQEKAKPYFTSDAWMCVCNTLESLKRKDTTTRSIYSFSSGIDISPYKDKTSVDRSPYKDKTTANAQSKHCSSAISKPQTVSVASDTTTRSIYSFSSGMDISPYKDKTSVDRSPYKDKTNTTTRSIYSFSSGMDISPYKDKSSMDRSPYKDKTIANAEFRCHPSPISKSQTVSSASAQTTHLNQRTSPVSKFCAASATNAHLKRCPSPVSKSQTLTSSSGSKKRKDNIVDEFEENRKMNICSTEMLHKDKKYDDILKRNYAVRLTDIALVEDIDLYIREAKKKI